MLGNCYACPDWQLSNKVTTWYSSSCGGVDDSLAILQAPGMGKQLDQTAVTRPPQAS